MIAQQQSSNHMPNHLRVCFGTDHFLIKPQEPPVVRAPTRIASIAGIVRDHGLDILVRSRKYDRVVDLFKTAWLHDAQGVQNWLGNRQPKDIVQIAEHSLHPLHNVEIPSLRKQAVPVDGPVPENHRSIGNPTNWRNLVGPTAMNASVKEVIGIAQRFCRKSTKRQRLGMQPERIDQFWRLTFMRNVPVQVDTRPALSTEGRGVLSKKTGTRQEGPLRYPSPAVRAQIVCRFVDVV